MEPSARTLGFSKGYPRAPPPTALPLVASFATTAPTPRISTASSPRSRTPQDPHAPHILPVSPTSTISRSSSPERSSPSKRSTSPKRSSSPSSTSPPVPFRIAYPLLPSMDPCELHFFHRGAQIALENILDDYLGNPDMSVFEVVADLEDKRPVVGVIKEDWQRRCMVEGARWVGEAVGACWEEWFEEDEGSDEDDCGDGEEETDEGNNEGEDDNVEEVELETVDDVSKGDEIGQIGDSMMVDGGAEQPDADGEKTGHGLSNAGLDDTETTQQEVGEAANEDRRVGGLAVDQGPIAEHIISPPDKLGDSNGMVSDGAGIVKTEDGSRNDEEERRQDAKEAKVVACMLRLLGRWIELQVEHAAKTGQADR
ncbi:hypothetical protein E8E11_008705 [Didymella keratinophila]|nr:hypothetical protein E8E11_008705 [Didymella keratinophila]